MTKFKEISIKSASINPFDLKNDWMLVTAAKSDGSVNTMTASWGGWGIMWNKEVAFVVIRPQRYTKEFMDDSEFFSLSFFDKSYLKDLTYLGKVSGRDEDKIAKSGLTLVKNQPIPYFNEAKRVILVRKLFVQPMEESSFLEEQIVKTWYPSKDFHYLYIAEIQKVLEPDTEY